MERRVLDEFRKYYPEFPKGKIVQSESPDFILETSPKHTVGIELSALPSSSLILNNKRDLYNLIEEIHHSVIKKDEKLPLYRKQRADEYWLLLYIDSLQDGPFNLKEHLPRTETMNGYNRVFLFDIYDGKVFIMK